MTVLTIYLIVKIFLLYAYRKNLEAMTQPDNKANRLLNYYYGKYYLLGKIIVNKRRAHNIKSYYMLQFQYNEKEIYKKILDKMSNKLIIMDKLLILSLLSLVFIEQWIIFLMIFISILLVSPLIDFNMNIDSKSFQVEIKNELPIILTKFSLLTKASINVRKSFEIVAYSGDGIINKRMQEIIKDIANGMEEKKAISQLNKLTNAMTMKKLTSAINQNIAMGTSNFDKSLDLMKDESWNEKRSLIKTKSKLASQKLLIPNVIMFVGIMVMIMIPMLSSDIGG